MPIPNALDALLSSLRPTNKDEVAAYIESATSETISEHFVLFPDNPKNLQRHYDTRSKNTFVFMGNEWLKEDTPAPSTAVVKATSSGLKSGAQLVAQDQLWRELNTPNGWLTPAQIIELMNIKLDDK